MAKYVVIVVEMSLKNNKTATGGSIIEEEQLASSAEDLVKKGYLRKATKSEIDALKKDVDSSLTGNVKPYSKWNKEELHAELKTREIEFEEAAINSDLAKLLEEDDKTA